MRKNLGIFMLFVGLPLTSMAQSYFGVGGMYLNFKQPGFSNVNPIASNFIAGSEISPTLSLEGRFGFGIASGQGDGYQLNVERHIGFYVRPSMASEAASVYGLFGLTEGKVRSDFNSGGSATSYDFSISGGAGVVLDVGSDLAIQAEWLSILDRPSYSFSAFSATILRSF